MCLLGIFLEREDLQQWCQGYVIGKASFLRISAFLQLVLKKLHQLPVKRLVEDLYYHV